MANGSTLTCPTCTAQLPAGATGCYNCHNEVSGGAAQAPSPDPEVLELDRAAKTDQEPCPACGSANAVTALHCSTCGASTLWDLSCDGSKLPSERAYVLARELSQLTSQPFRELSQGLKLKGYVLAAEVHRRQIDRLVKVLEERGVPYTTRSHAQPTASQPAPKRNRAWLLGGVLSLGLLGGVAGAAVTLRGNGGKLGPLLDSLRTGDAPRPATPQKAPTGAAAKVSMAAIKCKDSLGSGFFVTDELLVTNAHVVCAGEPLQHVELPDGRQLLGKLKKMDRWIDLAVIEVAGAAVKPLQVADASLAQEGDKVTMVGSPLGLDFTVHSAELSFIGRNSLGVAYLQFDGTVNPGNSGGPLIDSAGKVVGVVAMKVMKAERLGLAIPINYLYAGDSAMMRELQPEGATDGWAKMVAKVAHEDEVERAKMASAFTKPGVLFARALDHRGLGVLFVVRSKSPPPEQAVRTATTRDGKTLCADRVLVGGWETLEKYADSNSSRQTQWLMRNGLAKDLYVSLSFIENPTCYSGLTNSGAQLTVLEGDDIADHTEIQ